MAWFRFWSTVFVPEFVYKVETAGGAVILAAAACHRQQLPAQFGGRDGHDIVSTLPVFCRDVVRDSALDRLPRHDRTSGFPLKIDQHQYAVRSEEHTSELQSLLRKPYAVFCLKKKTKIK